MKILTEWLRTYLPVLDVDDRQLAEDLTLRGIAVEGVVELNDRSGNSEATLFDMDITTNRVDAMNHYGIAREAAAIYGLPLLPLDTKLPLSSPAHSAFPVRIEATDLCGRFSAQVIRDVCVAPTEGVIGHYFEELGLKMISNAVDISNFILFGMGHPNHVFDLDKIDGGITVRRAHRGEQIKLLDGTTRTLVSDDLVIADESKALGLAGVMGGFESMITAETKNILVEAAWFAPAGIRASSRRHLIHTDASHRYERGADFAAVPVASALVSRHILAACGGRLEGELVDVVVSAFEQQTSLRPPIQLAVSQVQRVLGTTLAAEGLSAALVERFLTALGCKLTPLSDDAYLVQLPSWRLDLTREIDLIEEIARVYGYNGFANTLPAAGVTVAHPRARMERAIRDRLYAFGFSEAISSTFASASKCAIFAPSIPAVALENPLNDEAAYLRTSLLPGMATMLAHNQKRDVLVARLFELGDIFSGSAVAVKETASLVLGLTGAAVATSLYSAQDASFFELKGVLESLLNLFALPSVSFTDTSVPDLYEKGRAASVLVNGKPWASLGQLSAGEASRLKLRQPVYLAEVDLASLLRFPLRHAMAREISRFQAVERDFSFVFPESLAWGSIREQVLALEIDGLKSVVPIEIRRDESKHPGVFSTLIRTVFQSHDRTLRDEDLTEWSAAIVGALQRLGGVIRS